ncbi:hypothetical protein EON67_02670 [archaeon]|nr:MAG: hypothetical protein EON67_02670 [archaeon]
MKGIYPRDPKSKKAGNAQSWYHVKDIAYLSHEPLLFKFRELKVRPRCTHSVSPPRCPCSVASSGHVLFTAAVLSRCCRRS